MLKVFFVILLLTIVLNILNSYYIPKCKLKLEKYFHALMPSTIATMCAMFYFMLLNIFKANLETLSPLNIITHIAIAFIFLIVNAFVVISKGIDDKKDNEVSIGLVFIFTLPIIFLISLPLELTFYIILKIRKTKIKEVKVTEEEIFEDTISLENYQTNEISVSEYLNELKYNSNIL